MSEYAKCECGAFFEPTTCIVCQEERWIERIEELESQLSQAREALEEIERAEFYSPEGAAELVWELHRIARAALAAMKGEK